MDRIITILVSRLEENRNYDGKEEIAYTEKAIKDYEQLKDKLRRRNLQIKDLKKKLELYEGNEQTYKDFKRCAD